MAGLIDIFVKSQRSIELGEVKQILGNREFLVTISGVDRKVFSSIPDRLTVGNKVVVTRMETGKLFVVNKTGFTGRQNELKEVFIDG